LSFGTDAWTSPNSKAYIAVTVHLEQKGVPLCMLLDIIEVAESHSGINLAAAFSKILNDFGIAAKVSMLSTIIIQIFFYSQITNIQCQVLSITCDNASSNDSMIDELSVLLKEFPGSVNRTRCFTHTLNLVAKSIMKQFDLPKAKAGDALDAAAEALANLASGIEREERLIEGDFTKDDDEDDDDEGLTDIREEMSAEDIAALEESLKPVRLALVKVNSISD